MSHVNLSSGARTDLRVSRKRKRLNWLALFSTFRANWTKKKPSNLLLKKYRRQVRLVTCLQGWWRRGCRRGSGCRTRTERSSSAAVKHGSEWGSSTTRHSQLTSFLLGKGRLNVSWEFDLKQRQVGQCVVLALSVVFELLAAKRPSCCGPKTTSALSLNRQRARVLFKPMSGGGA